MTPAIDSHVHVWTSDASRYPRSGARKDAAANPVTFTPGHLFNEAHPAGVERIVLVQMSFYGFDNAYMLDAMKEYPGAFSGIAVIDHTAGAAAEMRRLAKLGVRGFRVGPNVPLDAAYMAATWRCAAETGLAICPLLNPDGLPLLGRMAEQYPEANIVIDHMARIGADGEIRDTDVAALCALAKNRRVHVKVSAFYALGRKRYPYLDLAPMIRRLVDAYGPQRLMWGSDSPFQLLAGHTYAGSVSLIRERLDFLQPQDREWILGKTAEGIFFTRR
ncbi:MAG TPA: amidohydrolase family protein [Bryobacteraceae bacterium]|nr:amidohydrolase family protein [Bryobacteraceae bacterium]